MSELTRDQAVRLVAFVADSHESDSNGCHTEPGVDCVPWCAACRVLDGLPAELVATARMRLATTGRELSDVA